MFSCVYYPAMVKPLGSPIRIKNPCVYILANRENGTIYVGVTSNLAARVWQHKNDVVPGFTSRHRAHSLVWYEAHANMTAAIEREKAIKKWRRAWKIQLIEKMNPSWKDLYAEIG